MYPEASGLDDVGQAPEEAARVCRYLLDEH